MEAIGTNDDVATARPVIFLLHALGGSARSFDAVVADLSDFDCRAIDLPGFGDAAGLVGFTVEEMADHVAAAIQATGAAHWMIVGHSMGGKIAAIVARRAAMGELPGLAGVVLIAASPPSPEPIDDDRRAEMIGWAVDGPIGADEARVFVENNIASSLPPAMMDAAVADVRRSDRQAWLAWLERGSREDWSAMVGTLAVPAMIIAGAEDGDLGEANQRRLNAPHYRDAVVEVIAGAAHLMPLERPVEVATLIRRHWDAVVASPAAIPADYAALIASDRVSARTRGILMDRARPDDPDYRPTILSPTQLTTLRAVLARVVPQGAGAIDLAARIDAQLHEGVGDGWRFAALPADADAYRAGLDTVPVDFAALDGTAQDAVLTRIEEGDCPPGALSAEQMTLWFEDLRADAVRCWLSHPATMARIGYDGFATGGDGERKQGFQRTGADDRDAWEPVR